MVKLLDRTDATEIQQLTQHLISFTHRTEDADEFHFAVIESAPCLWICCEIYLEHDDLRLIYISEICWMSLNELRGCGRRIFAQLFIQPDDIHRDA